MNNNLKKILCLNILSSCKCKYGDHCIYAHSLKEQNITAYNKKVYDILNSTYDLSHINLLDIRLYKCFLKLTKVCKDCVNKSCPGGYNCKNGAISEEYTICYDDLVYNKCEKENCKKIHLTKRGLISFIEQKKAENYKNRKNNYNHNCKKDNYQGILLTEENIRDIVNNNQIKFTKKGQLSNPEVTPYKNYYSNCLQNVNLNKGFCNKVLENNNQNTITENIFNDLSDDDNTFSVLDDIIES